MTTLKTTEPLKAMSVTSDDAAHGEMEKMPLVADTSMDNHGATSKGGLLIKAARMVASRGPGYAVRRAVWRLHYDHFERRRKERAKDAQLPSMIRFLDNDFEMHPSNEGVSEELRLFGSHEPTATAAYLEHLSPGDHVVDVGSNIGYYLLLAAKKVGGTGRLLGFEPAPGVYEVLERNVQRSGFKNISLKQCAVGAKEGTVDFYESEIPNWGSIFQDSRLQQTRVTTVEAKRVDDLVRATPDFHPKALRMDVEGAELMVLEGAREVLAKYKPCLFIEFHNFALGWPAVRATLIGLRGLGYSSGVLIERTWDQPWMSEWMRKKRTWKGDLDSLIEQAESSRNPLVDSTIIFILTASRS